MSNPFAFGTSGFGVDSFGVAAAQPVQPGEWSADGFGGWSADGFQGWSADGWAHQPPPTPVRAQSTAGTLKDLAHFWGGDIGVSSSGDLLTSSGLQRSQQRILRRLNTNPGSYIGQPTYGAGLPQFIGKNADSAEIGAVTRTQMLLEDSVAQNRAPVVTVSQSPDGSQISETIQYTDSPSNAPTVLAFTVAD